MTKEELKQRCAAIIDENKDAIKAGFTPKFTRESYLEFWKQFSEGNVDRTGF